MSLLKAEGLSKRFGGLVAVDKVSFSIRPGEILGLIGPNGSGKSTTMSLVMGIVRPDSGKVLLDDVDITGWAPHRIAKQGLSIVFQHSRPLHRQTVLENIMLALLPDSLVRLIADPQVEAKARDIAARVGLAEVANQLPDTLPFADLRRLELAKAIARDPKVLLIDEPFAGLTAPEMHAFSDLIATFRSEGRAVMLVDHNVKGVRALVDRVLAMYVGQKIAEGDPDEVMSNAKVRSVYLGGSLDEPVIKTTAMAVAESAKPLLSVQAISVHYGKAQALDKVGFEVHEGEFVSIVGLNGAGKTTLFNAISGFVPYGGDIAWDGRSQHGRTPGAIARGGIVQCPESRELFGDMTVAENLGLGGQRLPKAELERELAWLFELFPVLGERRKQTARTLSGGEQQMLAIGRALMMKPRLLILDEPTLGLAPVVLDHISQALEVLRKETKITLVLGEQNVTFALKHSDRIYLLEHGQIVWQGDAPGFIREAGERYL